MSAVISGGKTVAMDREPFVSKQLQTMYSHTADIMACGFSKDYFLALCSSDKLARLWMRNPTGKPVENGDPGSQPGHFVEVPQSPLCGHSYAINCCEFSPDGKLLATCSQDGRVVFWEVETGAKYATLQHESGSSIRVGTFSPNGELFATGCDDDTVGLFEVANGGRLLKYLEGHECSIVGLSFSPDNSFLVSGATDGDMWVWDVRHGAGRYVTVVSKAHDLGVNVVAFSPKYANGLKHLLASAGNDEVLYLWRITPNLTGDVDTSVYAELTGHSSNIMCLAFRPDGTVLASGAGDKTVILWDPITGGILGRIVYHQRYVTCCAFSFSGDLLVTGSNDKTAVVWEVGPPSLIDFSDAEEDKARDGREILDTIDIKLLQTPPGGSPRRPVASDWTVNQVADWIQSLGLQEHRGSFIKHKIDGQELLFLTDTMLRKTLGIEPLGQRNKILRGVATLRSTHRHFDPSPDPSPGRTERSLSLQVIAGGPLNRSLHTHTKIDRTLSTGGNVGSTPHEFFCPITHEVMHDPVVAADGYSYERRAISGWIQSGKHSSPMTNAPMHHLELIPNRSLKMLIQKSTS